MSSLEEAQRKIAERRAAQPQGGGGQDLWMRQDDLLIAHCAFTGQDGDPYFETYVAHEHPAKPGSKWGSTVYCPVLSGHDENYDCQGCRDNLKTKDRMIMWFHVYSILHASLKPDEKFEQVNWNNKIYFNREINGPRVWDASAWRESPLDDIIMLGSQLGNIQATRINMVCSGVEKTRRYKFYMEPGSDGLDPEVLAADIPNMRPVLDILKDQLNVPAVQANPNPTAQAAAPAAAPAGKITPFVPAGGGTGNVPAYKPSATPAKKDLF